MPFTDAAEAAYSIKVYGFSDMRITPIFALLALLLAGCVSKAVDVSERGVRPELLGGAGLAVTSAGTGDVVGPVVVQRLQDSGIAVLEASGAGYLAELSYSQRPLPVGAYAGPVPEDPADAGAWVLAPGKRSWWTPRSAQQCSLALRLVDPKTGVETYAVRASVRGRGEGCWKGASAELAAVVAGKVAPAS